MSETIANVREIIDSFNKDITNINETDDLQKMGFDSVDFVQLVVKIEAKFGIFVDDEDLLFENFDTMQKIADYVEKAV